MAHHIPPVTALVPGVMRIHEENGTELRMAVGGFMEVSPENKVTVLRRRQSYPMKSMLTGAQRLSTS